eukprot:TRINITY_DN161_c0_g1_i1.p1 TRINITY_DN161_c0_g1~~TRINITY_DN161_c0_g1_i1.p1  ORF type:complete len:476 (-),score=86.52 TRINITY_DN161_c0_g1_i1:87-1514(-)
MNKLIDTLLFVLLAAYSAHCVSQGDVIQSKYQASAYQAFNFTYGSYFRKQIAYPSSSSNSPVQYILGNLELYDTGNNILNTQITVIDVTQIKSKNAVSIAGVNTLNIQLPKGSSGVHTLNDVSANGISVFAWTLPDYSSILDFFELSGTNPTNIALQQSLNLPYLPTNGIPPGKRGIGYFLGMYVSSSPVISFGVIDARNPQNTQISSQNMTDAEFDLYFNGNMPTFAFQDETNNLVYYVNRYFGRTYLFDSTDPLNLVYIATYNTTKDFLFGYYQGMFVSPVFDGYIYGIKQNGTADPNNPGLIQYTLTRFVAPGNPSFVNLTNVNQTITFVSYGDAVTFGFNTVLSQLYIGTSFNKLIKISLSSKMDFNGYMSIYPSLPYPTVYGGDMSSILVDSASNMLYSFTNWWGYFYAVDLSKFIPDGYVPPTSTTTGDNNHNHIPPYAIAIPITVVVVSAIAIGIFVSRRNRRRYLNI